MALSILKPDKNTNIASNAMLTIIFFIFNLLTRISRKMPKMPKVPKVPKIMVSLRSVFIINALFFASAQAINQ
jgi:hypothetical protein